MEFPTPVVRRGGGGAQGKQQYIIRYRSQGERETGENGEPGT